MKTKKELVKEYKERIPPMGVFQVRNTITGKVFISSSTRLDSIWNRHKFQLDFGNHPNTALQQDWNQLGAESFVFEILDELKPLEDPAFRPEEELNILEAMRREQLGSLPKY